MGAVNASVPSNHVTMEVSRLPGSNGIELSMCKVFYEIDIFFPWSKPSTELLLFPISIKSPRRSQLLAKKRINVSNFCPFTCQVYVYILFVSKTDYPSGFAKNLSLSFPFILPSINWVVQTYVCLLCNMKSSLFLFILVTSKWIIMIFKIIKE